MSKELAPLRAFNRIIKPRTFIYLGGRMSGKTEMVRKEFERRQKDIECVKTALKEYNQLKIDYEETDRINDELNLSNHQLRDENIKLKKAFTLLDDCDIDIWLLKHCDYENYCRVRTLCLKATGNADVDDANREVINLPTEKEFDFLKEMLK